MSTVTKRAPILSSGLPAAYQRLSGVRIVRRVLNYQKQGENGKSRHLCGSLSPDRAVEAPAQALDSRGVGGDGGELVEVLAGGFEVARGDLQQHGVL